MITDYSRNIELNGKNKNYCSICDCDYNASSRNIFYELPKILIIHPERKNQGIKFYASIDFEEQLDIKLSEHLKNKKISYTLIGIIYHIFSVGYKGHNIAICKIKDDWLQFNDYMISKINIKDVKGNGVLLLVYEKNN